MEALCSDGLTNGRKKSYQVASEAPYTSEATLGPCERASSAMMGVCAAARSSKTDAFAVGGGRLRFPAQALRRVTSNATSSINGLRIASSLAVPVEYIPVMSGRLTNIRS